VGDGIILARRGTPVVALVTEKFWEHGRLLAAARGMPDLPRVALPYPVAGTGAPALARVADAIAPAVLAALRGEPTT
jgi:hypothetical protein